MNSTHDEQALAAPYVLGALDPAERRAFEVHAAACPACQAEIRGFAPVAEALALAVPQRTPRGELRQRVLATISGAPAGAAAPAEPVRARAFSWLPLAAAAVLAIGLGAYARTLHDRLSTVETRLRDAEARASAAERDTLQARRVADEAQAALQVLAAPDLTRIDLTGQAPAATATGRAMWSRARGMVFTTTNLPPPPAGRVYQVWVVTAQAPVSAGVIAPDATGRATAFFSTPPDIGAPVAIAVTLEPAPGVPAPTGERYLVGRS
jgi:anti-sigma-K factor RskA